MNAHGIRFAAIAFALFATLATAILGIGFVRKLEEAHVAQPPAPLALFTFDGAKIVQR